MAERSEPDDEFVVLGAGRSYRANTEISIPIARDESTKFLKPGGHVLQIVVETWPEEESQFDRLRKKWMKTGLLCGSNVRSEPESFEVQEHPKLEQCHLTSQAIASTLSI